MADPMTRKEGLNYPGEHAVVVTPSDSQSFQHNTRYLYVGVAGDVTVDMAGGEQKVLFKAMPVGLYFLSVSKVWSTGTTATNINAIW